MPTTQRPTVIEVDSADIGFVDRIIVERLSLSLDRGAWLAILGQNGAGKTRTLRTLCGLESISSGMLKWQGRSAASYESSARARTVTLVSQHQHDAFDNDVLHHVLLGRYPHHGPWRSPSKEDYCTAQTVLTELELQPLTSRQVTQLSGGERQRVAIAQALVQDTPLLLVDEPLSHQDPSGSARVLACLEAFRARGGTIVSAMHDVNLAHRFASHALFLDGTGEWEFGPAAALITQARVAQLYGVPVRRVDVGGAPWFVPELAR